MAERYILSYHPSSSEDDEKKLIAYINGSKFVEEWTHPYTGLFLLSSKHTAHELTDGMDDFLTQITPRYIIVNASGQAFGGRLPDSSWEWLEKNADFPNKQPSLSVKSES